MRRSILAGVIALSGLWAVGTLSVASAQTGQLTSEDKVLLASGELVMHPKNEQRGSLKLFGGQSWQVVDVPTDLAWRALQDLRRYKRFIPLATESKIKGQHGEEIDLAIRQQWGPVDISYVLQTTLDGDKRAMVFRLDHSQGHELRAGWGFLRVRPLKDGKTLVSFGAMVDIGDGVLVSVIRPAVRKDLLRIPTRFKKYVEGDGRALYNQ
ncbi:MAG: SRPBCC family protein [Myxococcota bacterium]